MTTYGLECQTCGVCGKPVECRILNSTNTLGSPDLDLRPAEMYRSTMDVWLQECDGCGYVGRNLEEVEDSAAALLQTAEYRDLASASHIPELARRFHRYALLHQGDRRDFGYAQLWAAWVCDDADLRELARNYRRDSADALLDLRPYDDTEEGASLGLTTADVLRRCSRFEEARELLDALQAFDSLASEDVLVRVASYERALCDKKDTGSYTVTDALQES